MTDTNGVPGKLGEDDLQILRRIVSEYSPGEQDLLDRPFFEWTEDDIGQLGFAILQAVVAEGTDSDGRVDERGEELEALFSRLPQF